MLDNITNKRCASNCLQIGEVLSRSLMTAQISPGAEILPIGIVAKMLPVNLQSVNAMAHLKPLIVNLWLVNCEGV